MLGAARAYSPNGSCWEGQVGRATPLCPDSSGLDSASPIQQSPGKKLQTIPASPTDGEPSGSRGDAGTCCSPKVLMEQAQLYLPRALQAELCSCCPGTELRFKPSRKGLNSASRANSCLEYGQRRLPTAYEAWHGHVPHLRGSFLPLASPCLASMFQGWFSPSQTP